MGRTNSVFEIFLFYLGNCVNVCTNLSLNSLIFIADFAISKNKKLTTFKEWGLDYKIEFDIAVQTQPQNAYTSVFHLSTGQNGKNVGARIPGVWVNKKGFLHFCTLFSAKELPWGNCFNHKIEFGQDYHVVIEQYEEDEVYKYEIEVDGQIVHSIQYDDAQLFSNVDFYASNPWDPPFTSNIGLMENFTIFPGKNSLEFIHKKIMHFMNLMGMFFLNFRKNMCY